MGSRCENGVSGGMIVSTVPSVYRQLIQEVLLVLDAALSQHLRAGIVVRTAAARAPRKRRPGAGS